MKEPVGEVSNTLALCLNKYLHRGRQEILVKYMPPCRDKVNETTVVFWIR